MGPDIQKVVASWWGESVIATPPANIAETPLHRDQVLALSQAHDRQKKTMLTALREVVTRQYSRRGESHDLIQKVSTVLSLDDRMVIGFSRRFAAYKRPTLLFQNLEKIKSILLNTAHPVTVIFAGKAHPNDTGAQPYFRKIMELTRDPAFNGSVIFVEDYDIEIAKLLVQGVDVWLNNPIYRLEASGTSGMKAAVNGVLNLSICDGWWAEGYDAEHGWQIAIDQDINDQNRDNVEAENLYRTLTREVIPSYYLFKSNQSMRWGEMMADSVKKTIYRFSTTRMITDYVNHAYL